MRLGPGLHYVRGADNIVGRALGLYRFLGWRRILDRVLRSAEGGESEQSEHSPTDAGREQAAAHVERDVFAGEEDADIRGVDLF
jgi:hypothetical protein